MSPRMEPGPKPAAGLSTVEFAVVGAVVFLILFGVIDVARAAFARAMLEEGARRAARLAAVCPVEDAYITAAARFAEKDWGARIIPNLDAGSVSVQYLDAAGAPVADLEDDFTDIRFVRVTVSGYEVPLFVPFLEIDYQPGPVSSTQPVESLGVTPTEITPCLPPP